MIAHTPGPWTAPNPASGEDVTVTAYTPLHKNPISIARVYGPGILSRATAARAANARLIAAAPELFSLFANIASCGKGDGPIDKAWFFGVIDLARATIAKAEGE